jgi:putative redox protein
VRESVRARMTNHGRTTKLLPVRMSLTATARSITGTLRQEVVIDGRHRLITDEPTHLGGEGCGPAPHELFPAALAACVSTTLVMYAGNKGWDVGEVAVDVDYDHHSTPRRFEIAIRLGGDLSDAQLERLDAVARACPLRRSIEAGVEFVESIERNVDATRRPGASRPSPRLRPGARVIRNRDQRPPRLSGRPSVPTSRERRPQ